MDEQIGTYEWQAISDDGTGVPAGEELMNHLKEQVENIARDGAESVWDRKQWSEDVRYCRWDGQDPTGLKFRKNLEGREPFPYEGAPDGRIRLADMLINERVAILTQAATRAIPQMSGIGLEDKPAAERIERVLRYIKRQCLDKDWRQEMRRAANYQESDSPGGVVLKVWWDQEWGVRHEKMNIAQVHMHFAELLSERGVTDPDGEAQALVGMLMDPENEEDAMELLGGYFETVSRKRLRKIVRELRSEGVAQFPIRFLKREAPKVQALRLYEDIFLPYNTRDFNEAPLLVEREWMTLSELRGTILDRGYSEEFVNEVAQHEGKTGFPETVRDSVGGDFSYEMAMQNYDPNDNRGYYEVLTAYWKAPNEDGVSQVVSLPFSKFSDVAGFEMAEPLKMGLDGYPFVFGSRECLTSRIMDTRGVAELAMTHQESLKRGHDGFEAYTQLATLPPWGVPQNRRNLKLVIGPLVKIPEKRPGEIAPKQMGQLPVGNLEHQDRIMLQASRYFGRPAEGVDPSIVILMTQAMVDDWLDVLRRVYMIVYDLMVAFMSPELVTRITNSPDPLQPFRGFPENGGIYDFVLDVDVRDLDMEYLVSLAEVVSKLVVPLDTGATIRRDRLVDRILRAINPQLAADTISDQGGASQREVTEEQTAYAIIKSGQEPEMKEGQNHQLRLQVLSQAYERDPEKPQEGPVMDILLNRLKHHQFQVQQEQNKMIGRLGTAPVE